MIGLKMAYARSDLFAAYVGSGQFVNAADGDALGYRLTVAQARAVGNSEAIKTLEAMGPPPWPDVKTRSAAKGWATRMTKEDDPASKMNVPAMLKDCRVTPKPISKILAQAWHSQPSRSSGTPWRLMF